MLIFELVYEFKKNIHTFIFSQIPFSVGDFGYIFLFLFLVYLLLSFIRKKKKNIILQKFIIYSNVFYFIYQVLWGMTYFQKPIIDISQNSKIEIEYVKKISLFYLEKCKNTRKKVNENKEGVFWVKNHKNIISEVIKMQKNLPKNIIHKKIILYENIKPSVFGKAMNYSGIYGYFNPISGEAQYNYNIPSTSVGFTIAHEFAHQMGYAREEEASFIAYLLGRNSLNNDLKYSVEYFVLKQLLFNLIDKDEDFVKNTIENFSPAMKKDLEFEKNFRKKHQGIFEDFFGFTNDIFLKYNQQDGSISYTYFVKLLLKYEMNKYLKN